MLQSRRIMCMPVSEGQIFRVLRGELRFNLIDLPADARAVGVTHDMRRDCFLIFIESASFDSVPLGEIFPLLPPFSLEVAHGRL